MLHRRDLARPFVKFCALPAAILGVVAFGAFFARNAASPEAVRDRTVFVSKGQWKVPLDTVRCLSANRTEGTWKKIVILGQDYADKPEIADIISKGFGGAPVKYDDPSCHYVFFVAESGRLPVRYKGQYTQILASVGVCEWSAPKRVDPNRCSQKNIWFFRADIAPLDILTIGVSAFVEPQDQDWKAFNPDLIARTVR
jgi:hypothetical protein